MKVSNYCLSILQMLSHTVSVCGKLVHDVTSEIQSHAKFTSRWSGIQCPETQPTYVTQSTCIIKTMYILTVMENGIPS